METLFGHFSPMMRGENVKMLQLMLNEAGYTDEKGNVLSADGKLGGKTFAALKKFITAHAALAGEQKILRLPDEMTVEQQINGVLYKGMLAKIN